MKSFHNLFERLLSLGALSLLGCCCTNASASCFFVQGNTVSITVSTPSTVNMPRDSTASMVFYSSPLAPPNGTETVRCNSPSDVQGAVNDVGPTPSPPEVVLPIGNSGLAWRWLYNGGYLGLYGYSSAYGLDFTFNGTAHGFSLVKIGTVTPGTVIPAGPMGEFRYGTLTAMKLYLANSITIVGVACQTPDVRVTLGTHAASEMSGVGATTAAVPFKIALNACPAGMSSIQYRIDPTTTVLIGPDAVVALDASSTANGIGVQLLDGAGNVFPLSTVVAFSGYSSATGGNYVIPMKARYYRTGNTVKAGTANSSMTFTMLYQ